ncbi:NAD(P)H-binding protein [Rhodococcus sp. HNM0569]|uniref:NAD(P)-dependent oxidoreductase n=1 Tax=Rhodococcus sp. HNM0569 TaxID=2716340 RepID=UPI00146E7CFD|nr:NAD(P)H-binding protein [Rhodococcus sp. HNM0569]NLU83273.1 NAD(P)H-binding protein [Rhodococcus sp. HNM0569]
MTTIAVVGATGYTGRHLVSEAVSRDFDVIAAARDVSSVEPGEHVTTRSGTLYDTDFVDALARDSDALVVAVPGRELDGRSLYEAISDIAEATARHQIRLGVVGGAASLHVSPGGPRLIDTADFPAEYLPEARGMYAVLVELERTLEHVDWFYVSPSAEYGAYADPPARGTYRLGGNVLLTEPDGTSSIAGADFAKAFVDEIENPTHFRERFTVGY